MIEIRKLISSYLKTIHPRLYYQLAPSDAEFPYLVYDFPTTYDDGELQEIITVDIDGWDQPNYGDTSAIENLMTAVNGDGDLIIPTGLNKRLLTADNIAVLFYLENKIPIVDDDKSIQRRKYVYQARLINKE